MVLLSFKPERSYLNFEYQVLPYYFNRSTYNSDSQQKCITTSYEMCIASDVWV